MAEILNAIATMVMSSRPQLRSKFAIISEENPAISPIVESRYRGEKWLPANQPQIILAQIAEKLAIANAPPASTSE